MTENNWMNSRKFWLSFWLDMFKIQALGCKLHRMGTPYAWRIYEYLRHRVHRYPIREGETHGLAFEIMDRLASRLSQPTMRYFGAGTVGACTRFVVLEYIHKNYPLDYPHSLEEMIANGYDPVDPYGSGRTEAPSESLIRDEQVQEIMKGLSAEDQWLLLNSAGLSGKDRTRRSRLKGTVTVDFAMREIFDALEEAGRDLPDEKYTYIRILSADTRTREALAQYCREHSVTTHQMMQFYAATGALISDVRQKHRLSADCPLLSLLPYFNATDARFRVGALWAVDIQGIYRPRARMLRDEAGVSIVNEKGFAIVRQKK